MFPSRSTTGTQASQTTTAPCRQNGVVLPSRDGRCNLLLKANSKYFAVFLLQLLEIKAINGKRSQPTTDNGLYSFNTSANPFDIYPEIGELIIQFPKFFLLTYVLISDLFRR